MHAVILGKPRTKKTHNRACEIGKRCPKCRRGARTMVLPSEAFEEWEEQAAPQLRKRWAEVAGPARVVCDRCDGKGRKNGKPCLGCGAAGLRPRPYDRGYVWIEATIYRDADRGDLLGYLQALADALETAGVVKNDGLIRSWDGCRLDKDAANPRVEFEIKILPGEAAQASMLDEVTPL